MKLKLYGTHHLLEKEKIVKAIEDFNPDVVCIELDEIRLKKLQGKEIDETYLKQISWFSKFVLKKIKNKSMKIAEGSDQKYGGDMISALQYCGTNNLPVKLIDMGVIQIAKGFDKVNWGEKVLLYMGIGFSKTSLEDVNNINEETTKANLEMMKAKLPNLYNHLVVGRNKFMANRIMEVVLLKKYERVLVFVGNGHIEGIKGFLDENGVDVK